MLRASSLNPTLYLEAELTADDLQASPMATNGMKLLRYASQEGDIPLTRTMSAFHRKCVEWAASEFQWPGFELETLYAVNKVLNEPDFPPLSVMHEMFINTRLMRHRAGIAQLTKAGTAILGHYGELQALVFDWLLAGPAWQHIPEKGLPLFWDIEQILKVVAVRLGDWVTVGDFTELVVPIDLFPTAGSLGARFEASLYVASNVVRPLLWMGLLMEAESNTKAMRVEERLIKKTPLFERFVRFVLPLTGAGRTVH